MSDRCRVLFVDDEPEILAAIKLNLRKKYLVSTANSGAEALSLLEESQGSEQSFDAVISDMRMPSMNGAEFLSAVRNQHPDLPRLLLSGQSDLDAAIAAINDAKIFRFLTKPCPNDLLIESIDEAIEHARLRQVERELLDQTLSGTVSMLTEVLGLVNAGAYGRTIRLRGIIASTCDALDRPVPWDLNLATMLSQIGFVVIPSDNEAGGGGQLEARHVDLARDLLANIPRLESVACMVGQQLTALHDPIEGPIEAWPNDVLNAAILRSAVAFEALLSDGRSRAVALAELRGSPSIVPPPILKALAKVRPDSTAMVEVQTRVENLAPGMELTADVNLKTGPMLAPSGTQLTSALVGRIRAFATSIGVKEPILVLVPVSEVGKVKA